MYKEVTYSYSYATGDNVMIIAPTSTGRFRLSSRSDHNLGDFDSAELAAIGASNELSRSGAYETEIVESCVHVELWDRMIHQVRNVEG